MALHTMHKGEEFFFLQNYRNYTVYYNEHNVPLCEAEKQVRSGIFYLAVHKKTGKTVEWTKIGNGAFKAFKEWLDFLELPREA